MEMKLGFPKIYSMMKGSGSLKARFQGLAVLKSHGKAQD